MAEIAVSLARNKLLPLIRDKANLLWNIPKEFADIKTDLEDIQGFLKDADRRAAEEGDNTNEGIKTFVKQLREASFRVEDVIDEYMIYVQQQPRDSGRAALLSQIIHFIETLKPRHQIASEIHQIKSVIEGILQRGKKYNILNKLSSQLGQRSYGGSQSIQWSDPRPGGTRFCYEVVGFEGPRDKLVGWLVDGPAKLTVISVVGMGGLGKTTLAGRVFQNEKVKSHFDFHAWIVVSQGCTAEKLMGKLLNKLRKEEGKKLPQMDLDSLIEKVRENLHQKRYVVIFDDVWGVELWGHIENAMLDNNNGSIILITTRKMDVVNSCKKSSFVQVHDLEPLSFEKSMELFCKKAFRDHNNECCPKDLVDISSDFVQKCKGLPLAIVAIGSLLHGKKTPFEWEKVRRSLSSEMEKNSVTKILSLSYDDMPYYLKSCFLYFGIYPEDYAVKSTRIIRQWIAEGFVIDEKGKTLEDVAQEYLTELIGRSLVQVSSFTTDGKASCCRVHDLIREMILRKFKDLSFCQHISREDELISSGMIRRLSIATNSSDLMESTENSHIRSLFVFAGKELASVAEFLEGIPTKYRLLKVFDFENGEFDCVPENWGNLIHLKYLSLRYSWIETDSLPKSIGKLLNLETLDIRNASFSEMPKEICNLTNLRHLLGFEMKLFQLKNGLGGMTNLQTLCQVSVNHDEDELIKDDDVVELLRELGKLKQLRKLGVVHLNERLVSALCLSINEMQDLETLHIQSAGFDVNAFSVISSLPMLRKLKLEGKLSKFPKWVLQLQNLVKLTLRYSQLTDDPLKWLQSMSYLLFLRIGYDAYEGESLRFQDGGFPKLKELCLGSLSNLNSIIIDKGAFCSLEKLQLWEVSELKTVPHGIQHLEKLKFLDLCYMPDEFKQCIAPHMKKQNIQVSST